MRQASSDTPIKETRSPGAKSRLHFLDHLRAVIILLVITLHASMTYMAYPPEWWYVIEPHNSLLFTKLVLILDVPSMQVLFFIAGFFAYSSLERHGLPRFLKQKALRLGLPWLVGVVFLAPLVTYLIPVTRGSAKPYLEFWLTDFWGPYYQQAVYWFLGILFLLFVLFASAYNSEISLQHLQRQSDHPTPKLWITFGALTTLWFFLSSHLSPADTWTNALIFSFQPARLLLYAGYFVLGVYADRKNWFRENGYRPSLRNWTLAMVISGWSYLSFRLSWAGGYGLWQLGVQAALFNAFCLSGLMASTAWFQRFLDQPSRPWSSLARNAFAIYYLHPLILYPAAYLALSVEIPIFVEATLLILLTALISWGLGALVLTRWPVLRDIF